MQVKTRFRQTDLGQIPEGWEVMPLDKTTDPNRPISYGIVQTGPPIRDGVRCVRVLDLDNGRIDKEKLITTTTAISNSYRRTVLDVGDLVIALRGKIGELAVVRQDLVGANLTRGVALIAPLNCNDSFYLYYYLSSSKNKNLLERRLNGSALQEIPIGTLRKIPIVVPPLPEQRAIANALADVDALINSLDRLIAKKRDIKQATIQKLLTGKTRLPGFRQKDGFKQTEIGLIPEDWSAQKVSSLASYITVGFVGSMAFLFVEDGVPLLRGQNVKPQALDLGTLKYISVETHRLWKKSALQPGDVVIVRVGYPGTACVIPSGLGDLNAASLVVVRPNASKLSATFLSYVLNSSWGYRQIQALLVGGAQQVFNTRTAADFVIPAPHIEEQSAIAEILVDLDAELSTLEQRRDKTIMIKQGMMQELLTGRTRLL